MLFTALRHIEDGEELLVSYMSPLTMAADERRQALDAYGFVCTCPSCLESTISDPRRERIADDSILRDQDAFRCWLVDPSLSDNHFLLPLFEKLQLTDAEGLYAESVRYVRAVFLIYVALGDHDNARQFEQRMVDLRLATAPSTSLSSIAATTEDIARHELWDARHKSVSNEEALSYADKFWSF
jgi:hypothetical protein